MAAAWHGRRPVGQQISPAPALAQAAARRGAPLAAEADGAVRASATRN